MPKIEDYALLGDLHTAALVSTAGSVDWLCLPRFDSPAAFAALLHNEEAGHWTLAPAAAGTCTTRRYAGNTLVLETDWVTADGAVRVIDFMPPRARTPHLIRIAVGLSGQVAMRSVLRLRFDYGRVVPWVRQDGPQVHAIAGPDLVLPYCMSWGAGFIRNEGLWIYGPGRRTFGHSGWGGSCAFADPETGVSGAYVMNRQSAELIADSRARRLIEAAYAAL